MRTFVLPNTDIHSSTLAYGCMRISGTWNPAELTSDHISKGKASLRAAYEAGFTLFDHADIYGRGTCEQIHGELLNESPDLRKSTILATKCGIRWSGDPAPNSPHRYDFSASHILRSAEASLRRLQSETIDIYQLHRPDLLMDPEEIAEAFVILKEQGKVRYFGVSNFLPAKVAALQAYLPFPLVVNQVEIHLARLEPYLDGTLEQCLERKITPLAWSPLAGGLLGDGGTVPEGHARGNILKGLLEVMDAEASLVGVSRTVIALRWLLAHPTKIVPIVGTVRPDKISDAAKATSETMNRDAWYRLLIAARGEALP